MKKHLAPLAALALAACQSGYWPAVDGAPDQSKYQADVRECQTLSQSAGMSVGSVIFSGGLIGSAFQAQDSKTPEGRAAIDNCMAARGYKIKTPVSAAG